MNILYWLRSDLRLHDNPALIRFAEGDHGQILWCPSRSQKRAKAFRSNFLRHSLGSFAESLKEKSASILIECRDIRDVLPDILRTQQFDLIVFSAETCTEEQEDEFWVRSLGIACEAFETKSLILQKDLPCPIEALPEVFTVFRKALEARLVIAKPLEIPERLPSPKILLNDSGSQLNDDIRRWVNAAQHPFIEAGESAALKRLDDYIWRLDRLRSYKETRDGLLDWNDSSKLSPWLALGSLSARKVYAEILRYERERIQNESTYWLFFELLWRDYFHWISLKWGSRLFTGMKSRAVSTSSPLEFEQWKAGQTGQPFIDAHMRELATTGWMSNRGRQNVANYWVKTLGGDWRLGSGYFEEQLIDYDPSSNWGNWSYQAGTGQDPRDRRFDPARQAELYDREGLYQKLWLDPDRK